MKPKTAILVVRLDNPFTCLDYLFEMGVFYETNVFWRWSFYKIIYLEIDNFISPHFPNNNNNIEGQDLIW